MLPSFPADPLILPPMPRSPRRATPSPDSLLEKLVSQIDNRTTQPAGDTVPTGFASLDRVLAGGLRRKDLVVIAGDVGSGKSAFGLGIAIRAAGAGTPTMYFSGEMSPERIMERALALEGKSSVDDLRQGRLSDANRALVGAAAVRLRHSPLVIRPLLGSDFNEVRSALDIVPRRQLLVIDSLEHTAPPRASARLQERIAGGVRALKSLALERDVVVVVLAQLPGHR